MKTTVGIAGVTGYSGEELLKILLRHPGVSVRYLAARRVTGTPPVGKLLPAFRGRTSLKVHRFNPKMARDACDLLLMALPHGVAMGAVPTLLGKPAMRVIDLSGDFRLHPASRFTQAYKIKHAAPSYLKHAVYGLTEWMQPEIKPARLIANPGCYPTAVLLGLAPLAKARLIAPKGLVVDAKSGFTGAGRSIDPKLLGDLMAYRVDNHQHTPEMEQTLKTLSGKAVQMTFCPQLIPMPRGIYAALYVPLTRKLTKGQLRKLYQKQYKKEPFVQLLPEGNWPKIQSVVNTNRCQISVQINSNTQGAIVIAAIDNLQKGAAGQAVQNMNVMLGFRETMGLSK